MKVLTDYVTIRAEELSEYLKTRPFAGCPVPVKLSGKNFKENVEGKTGIIFFKDVVV
ncbi:TPA: hypothetical protein OT801_001174 [Morganella morganii]|nr:hypothetical protein [Morganella morganii]MBT0313832.1 hypothetical protein [Morganella morganii subsp. morganii]ELB1545250.1 hypothetical protein [Morganella morganii]MBT0464159.1 hypothetical protein [Morganella morganii subsp. morganii]MBT0468708.1 hypothetical protein [Morganella morganii subsp. morganii]